MREFLFKAKRIDNGEWVEGYYQKRKDAFENDEHLILRYETYHTWEYVNVDPDTICQYTGLTDKNGNKIWENDIVKHYYDECHADRIKVGVIRWNGDEARFENFRLIEKYAYYLSGKKCVYEVIGNIFDNPDLLKVGD